jgi:hypothetical protein
MFGVQTFKFSNGSRKVAPARCQTHERRSHTAHCRLTSLPSPISGFTCKNNVGQRENKEAGAFLFKILTAFSKSGTSKGSRAAMYINTVHIVHCIGGGPLFQVPAWLHWRGDLVRGAVSL